MLINTSLNKAPTKHARLQSSTVAKRKMFMLDDVTSMETVSIIDK